MRLPQTATLDVLAPLGSEQDGYITTAQALELGVSRSRLSQLESAQYLERVHQGVYRITIGTPVIPRVPEWLYTRYLALDSKRLPWTKRDPAVVVSHECAAELLRIGNLPADIATFTSSQRRTTTLSATKIYVTSIDADDWEFIVDGRVPVTTAARTVVDLASIGIGRDYVERAIEDGINRQLTTAAEIRSVARRRSRSSRHASIAWLKTVTDS